VDVAIGSSCGRLLFHDDDDDDDDDNDGVSCTG
jgi:hypothetical protein